ncbi:hypothetical protein V1264_024359 [Littorina saxatilis]|uniref:C1q domain-containing protein n=1 Tax=Littorina saxatilis TaxID=31220 RepID=A0AAN9ALU8_9CAEN
MAKQEEGELPMLCATCALLLFCSLSAYAKPTNLVKRSDDSTLGDLKNVVQQQSAVIQQQSAVIQTIQTKMTAMENQMAKLQQRVVFTAYFQHEGGTKIDIGQSSPIPFQDTSINLGNGYDPHSGVFTAPVSGVYFFTLHIKAEESSKEIIEVGIEKSGTILTVATIYGDHFSTDHSSASVTTQVKVGEKVFVRHTYGGTSLDKWKETSFTGILLYPD